nr:TRAP transporter small permease [Oceanobacter mangrovi]
MVTPTLRLFCRASDLIVKIAGHLAAMLMPVLAGVVAFEVFSRYLLDAPTIWGYDTALFLFGYIAALGGAYAQQKRAHINVDILYLKVSGTTRRLFDLLTGVLGMFFLYVMIVMALGKYEEAIEFDYRTQSEWAAPMWHFWVMIVVAASLFLLQLVRDFITNLYRLIAGKPLLPADEADDSDDDFAANNTADSADESAQKTS